MFLFSQEERQKIRQNDLDIFKNLGTLRYRFDLT